MDGGNAVHIPVMLRETLFYLEPKPGDVIADCTVGAGGHAVEILAAIQPGGRLIGIDRDAEILQLAGKTLDSSGFAGCFELHQANFADLDGVLPGAVDGMLFDLGVSSLQLDRPERGFSFNAEGPLDMRMDPSRGQPVGAAIRRLTDKELAAIIRDYGEERYAWRIAKAIKQAQETTGLRTTRDLAETVYRAVPQRPGRSSRLAGIHPATRTFQALRIYVNRELDALADALQKAPGLLKPGGRVVVISYHSLEDRIAKRAFREQAARGEIEILTRKPIRPQPDEVERNRRSRSARLRAARRMP
ncbi:MAG TPA: 16S rRNA (cytosine(1402)-N(4))-methyltransferase RsmH [Planctomycetota bacterium]|nr:16S rRNA (cytosine(1402)-N(4))-methyltransferase RsmH [Planctomycetota bacterium]